jgi:DNA sulfur modification protein DndC
MEGGFDRMTEYDKTAEDQKSPEKISFFDRSTLVELYEEVQDVYLADDRQWIIGYSGGKDSTAALQVVWHALSKLPEEKRKKMVHVICTDTLVETPVIVEYINNTLHLIDKAAGDQKMPFKTHRLNPEVNDSFWVNLIGRGYPAPQRKFRWCTERMKIKPADKFITQTVSEHGEVILVLGIRKSESMTRAQVMSLYEIKGTVLSRHSTLPGAFVYAPVQNFTTNDVWTYLLQNKSPWGNNNRDLVAMYQNAQGECPLVVDTTTPSCGNSRFGCWVCTVVERDRSMESMIDHGQEWMESLLDFRDFLASTQDPAKKHEIRELKRRMGFVQFRSEKSMENKGISEPEITRGPYKMEFRRQILRRLLETQMKVRKEGPDPNIELILPDELHAIRKIWRSEEGDWKDSAPRIYKEVTGQDLKLIADDIGTFGLEESRILEELATKHDIPYRLVTKLIDVESQNQGLSKRASVFGRIDKVLGEEWRTDEAEILRVRKEKIERDRKLKDMKA